MHREAQIMCYPNDRSAQMLVPQMHFDPCEWFMYEVPEHE